MTEEKETEYMFIAFDKRYEHESHPYLGWLYPDWLYRFRVEKGASLIDALAWANVYTVWTVSDIMRKPCADMMIKHGLYKGAKSLCAMIASKENIYTIANLRMERLEDVLGEVYQDKRHYLNDWQKLGVYVR